MKNVMKYICKILSILVTVLFVSCFGNSSDGGDLVEEVAPPENRLYGILSDGYEIDNYSIKLGEAMGSILNKYGISAHTTYELEQAAKGVFPMNKIRGGNSYTTFIKSDSLGVDHLDYLVYDINKTEYVVFSLADSISVYRGVKPITTQRHKRTAVIDTSMWGAIMEANLPYALGAEIEDIYQWSVDFFTIQKGDCFTVIYEEQFVDDTISVGLGRILGAKFIQSNVEHYAIPFEQGDKLQYWEADGGSLRKQMLKAPLKYSRISSGFSYSRLHPVHKVYKPHTGVDYAAPIGTPVHSVADGVVTFSGWGGGGGNTLKVKHPGGFVTGYLHLKNFASGIKVGSVVKQGQTIGYVGSTGTSTGPHLDYRIWKGGVPINPLKVPQEPTEPISDENLASFEFVKQRIMDVLNRDIADEDLITEIENFAFLKGGVDTLTVTL